MGFVKEIKANTTMGHQSSPGYVLTFIRWRNRDVLNKTLDPLEIEKPLVVENDAIDIKVSNSKTGLTPSLDITLKNGDIDYSSVLGPGDFVFVNLLDWTTESRRVANKARAGQPINKYNDGFKGLFRIQTAGRNFQTMPNGKKVMFFKVQAFGFTEFNNIIYYNPVIASGLKDEGKAAYFWENFGSYLDKLKSDSEPLSIQNIIEVLIETLIGKGDLQKNNTENLKLSPNLYYKIPIKVGQLLGLRQAKLAADIYKYYLGVWGNDSGSSGNKEKVQPTDIGEGFNPSLTAKKPDSAWYHTKDKILGERILAPDYWNSIKVWAILKSYLNSLVNEMYTSTRVCPDGSIYPSVVIRQKPFTSLEKKDSFIKKKIPVTTYLSLPRWKVDPKLLYSFFLGKNEAARINFVQAYTRSVAWDKNQNFESQSHSNFQTDEHDIGRTGLRPFVSTSNFNFPGVGKGKEDISEMWSKLVADWVMNGHLREVGNFEFHGITEPIEVGDNIEFDNSVFHIESISHRWTIRGDGKKTFRTSASVSYGTSLNSTVKKTVFPHTDTTTYIQSQTKDFNKDKVLPGMSDTQDVVGRDKGIKG